MQTEFAIITTSAFTLTHLAAREPLLFMQDGVYPDDGHEITFPAQQVISAVFVQNGKHDPLEDPVAEQEPET